MYVSKDRTPNSTGICVGAVVRAHIEKHGLNKAAIARQIGRTPQTVCNLPDSVNMGTGPLLELCHALRYNFFQEIADLLPADYECSTAAEESRRGVEEALREEIKILRIQNELLKEVATGRK